MLTVQRKTMADVTVFIATSNTQIDKHGGGSIRAREKKAALAWARGDEEVLKNKMLDSTKYVEPIGSASGLENMSTLVRLPTRPDQLEMKMEQRENRRKEKLEEFKKKLESKRMDTKRMATKRMSIKRKKEGANVAPMAGGDDHSDEEKLEGDLEGAAELLLATVSGDADGTTVGTTASLISGVREDSLTGTIQREDEDDLEAARYLKT